MDNQVQQNEPFMDQDGQTTLFNLKELTVNSSVKISDLQEQAKTAKQMLEDVLLNDEVYKEKQETLKDRQKDLKMERAQIESQPSVAAIVKKVKDLRADIKERKAELSDYAVQVMMMTGANEIEKDGETYEIKTVAKLSKRG